MAGNKSLHTYQKHALFLCLLLGLLTLGSILWIMFHSEPSSSLLYADIYQEGELKQSILLSTVTESYTFTIYDSKNNYNQIEVRLGSIGIISADCPDKLCVHQGFIQNSRLPITCLPNRLVIQIRREQTIKSSGETAPDIITY